MTARHVAALAGVAAGLLAFVLVFAVASLLPLAGPWVTRAAVIVAWIVAGVTIWAVTGRISG